MTHDDAQTGKGSSYVNNFGELCMEYPSIEGKVEGGQTP
jgi:hypothetical protein